MRMHKIKILYIVVTYLTEVYLFGKINGVFSKTKAHFASRQAKKTVLKVKNVFLFGEHLGVRGSREYFFAPKCIKISNLDTVSFHKK